MRSALSSALGLILLITSALCHASNESRTISDKLWADDLQQLVASIKETHFKPFHVLSESDFDADVARLKSQISDLSEREIIVRMAQIVARLGDGHTRLHIPRLYPELALPAELGHSGTEPPKFDSLKFGQSPVCFELFNDGLFVVAARPEYRDLITHKVLSFDKTLVDDAIERVKSVSFFENDSRARLMAPDRLALPDVAAVLGISVSGDVVELTTVDNAGTESKTSLKTLNELGKNFVSSTPSSLPLWLAKTDEYRWYRLLPDHDAIYVQVNQFEEKPVTPYGDFVAETIAAAQVAGVSRFVIDLRHNSGGIGAWVTPFVTGLGGSEFNKYGRLFVLVGRNTFSAAQHFMHKFEEFTHAIFVGEQSGAKPSHFGDAKRIVLKNSGLTLRVSTIYWHSWLANDFRSAINPHISAPITSSDYFDGVDPVLDAALQYEAPGSLALQINEQFRQGHNQNALLLYQRYLSDGTIRDHRHAIPDLLTMADELVTDGLIKQGYFIYFLANSTYAGDPKIEKGLARIEALMK
ncbi:MAG: hypothetical protein OER80_02775 [Gammaproteobacteria bacterium]|nr:hypothetical protein [Gammaproteobacteria bacterium]